MLDGSWLPECHHSTHACVRTRRTAPRRAAPHRTAPHRAAPHRTATHASHERNARMLARCTSFAHASHACMAWDHTRARMCACMHARDPRDACDAHDARMHATHAHQTGVELPDGWIAQFDPSTNREYESSLCSAALSARLSHRLRQHTSISVLGAMAGTTQRLRLAKLSGLCPLVNSRRYFGALNRHFATIEAAVLLVSWPVESLSSNK